MNPWVMRRFGAGCHQWAWLVPIVLIFPSFRSMAETPFSEPYSINRAMQEFTGPGRDAPTPEDVKNIAIGYFGPLPEEDLRYADLYYGILLAIEEANEAGGYQGLPFRLVSRWATDPWGAGSQKVVRLAYHDNVWAVIGSVDGDTSHVAIQILTIARVALVAPTATVPGLTQAGVPWMFRLPPNDPSQAAALAAHMAREGKERTMALLSSTHHDSRVFRGEMIKALQNRPVSLAIEAQVSSLVESATGIRRLLLAEPDAICIALDPPAAALALEELNRSGWEGDLYGWGRLSYRSFFESANEGVEGMVVPRMWDPQIDSSESERFGELYRERFGKKPDAQAAYGYDAARLVIEAVRAEGLNRIRIRDGLASLSPFQGVTGSIFWDGGGGNTRPVNLWRWERHGGMTRLSTEP